MTNEEGDLTFTAATCGVCRIEEQTNDNNLEILIKKSELSSTDQARNTIYVRSFTGPPSSDNERSTTSLTKGSDVTLGGVVYQSYTNFAPGSWSSGARGGTYWRFFTSSPPADQNTETLDFIVEKLINEIDIPAVDWAQRDNRDLIPANKLANACLLYTSPSPRD